MREFETGATRNDDTNALDFEGFLSPTVLKRYAEYMHKHRQQKDGKIRDSDNWQKGIPLNSYMKSGFRHMFDWWSEHRGLFNSRDGLEDALCAVIFNASGYLHEYLKNKTKNTEVCSYCQCLKVSCMCRIEYKCYFCTYVGHSEKELAYHYTLMPEHNSTRIPYSTK